jgi:predicted DNA-binding transcriptional regulator YafY
MRNAQVSRIYKILTLLESTKVGMSIRDLHARIQDHDEVTDRTVRRDIEALEAAGFPVERLSNPTDPQAGDLFRIEASVKVAKHLTLSARELFALYMARGMLTPLKDSAFFIDLERVFQQIDALIPKTGREHFEELSTEVGFEPGPRWGLGVTPDILDTILAACTNAQVLRLEYTSPSKPDRRWRRLGPHFLYFSKGAIYLVAEDLEEKALKTYSVARATGAEMTDDPYDRPQTKPEDYFKGSFGVFKASTPVPIELKLKKEVVAYSTERRWHESQRVVKHADGSATLHLEVGLTPDLVQFVLGFGDAVEVKLPDELRQKVLEAALRVAGLYAHQARIEKKYGVHE